MMLFSTLIHATLLLLLLWHFSSFYSHPRIAHWHTKRTKQISTIIINERTTKRTKIHKILQNYWWWQNHTQIIKNCIYAVWEKIRVAACWKIQINRMRIYFVYIVTSTIKSSCFSFQHMHSTAHFHVKLNFCLLWNVHCFFFSLNRIFFDSTWIVYINFGCNALMLTLCCMGMKTLSIYKSSHQQS